MPASSKKPKTTEVITMETDFGAPAARSSTSIVKAERGDSGDTEAEEMAAEHPYIFPRILGTDETMRPR